MSSQTEQLQIAFYPRPNNYQPNIITESRQEFTEMEKKIVVLAINQLRQIAQSWQKGQNVTLLIPYTELTDSHHGKISAAANTLNTKRIVYQNFSDPFEPEFDYIVPFPRVRSMILNGKRHLELLMLSEVVPSFIELGKRYTSYSLKLMLSLSSIYAQRMYEIIMMFYGRGQKEFTYEVSKLRTALNYPPEHDYYDFKRKALTVAQSELSQKIGLQFDFTPSLKNGKAVTELRFVVQSDQDLINNDVEVDLLTAQTMQPHEVVVIARNLIHDYKFTKKQQNQILEDIELMNTFIRLHTEFHHGKRVAKNPTAYMAQALGFGKADTKSEPLTKAATGRKGKPKVVKNLLTDTSDKPKRNA
ncbi:replication initiation protein [Spirosoma sp. RP8]|uniref:Replication initiation protein n=1 Tax=Spirosoma liriopis TaxID=2937440 RepID=A0ABT0HV52_9BACT|nr:replication initiation protein [Spirosoma liriopis]MCK8495987.1 replication initiation protein [Spirosoma liriopis]